MKPQGFTAFEFIIAMAIALLMIGAFSTWFFLVLEGNSYSTNLLLATEEAQNSVTAFSREARETAEGEDGSYMIESAASNEFIFYSDINGDRNSERIRYFIQSGELQRGVISPVGFPAVYPPENEEVKRVAQFLVNDETQPLFQYYGEGYRGNMDPLPDPVIPSDVRLVHMFLAIDPDLSDQRVPFILETDVQLRNTIDPTDV